MLWRTPVLTWSYSNADCTARRIHLILLLLTWMGQNSEALPLQNTKMANPFRKNAGRKNVAYHAAKKCIRLHCASRSVWQTYLRRRRVCLLKANIFSKWGQDERCDFRWSTNYVTISKSKTFSAKWNSIEKRARKASEKACRSFQRTAGKLRWNCAAANFITQRYGV